MYRLEGIFDSISLRHILCVFSFSGQYWPAGTVSVMGAFQLCSNSTAWGLTGAPLSVPSAARPRLTKKSPMSSPQRKPARKEDIPVKVKSVKNMHSQSSVIGVSIWQWERQSQSRAGSVTVKQLLLTVDILPESLSASTPFLMGGTQECFFKHSNNYAHYSKKVTS